MKFAPEDEGYRRFWCGDELAWGLIHALGLPKNTARLEIIVEPGRAMVVRSEHCPSPQALVLAFAQLGAGESAPAKEGERAAA